MKDVLISIVNGNTHGYIYECVDSIYNKTTNVTYDVVVIDNCTGDTNLGSLEDSEVEVIRNTRPMGFSANHAQVISRLQEYRYLLIFNDDAYLQNDAVDILIAELDNDLKTVIAGCKIYEPTGELQPSIATFPKLDYFIKNLLGIDGRVGEKYPSLFTQNIDYDKSGYIDWVSGCCMLIRSEFIRQHGFLDTGYFMFLEDTDICRKAWNSGRKVKYIAKAEIVHHGGGSSKGERNLMKPWLFVQTQKSRLRYLRKESLLQYSIFLLFINIYVPARLIKNIIQGNTAWSYEVALQLLKKPLV